MIDSFLLALARNDGARGVDVMLDGTDGDGTLRAQEPKAADGVVVAECIAEDPAHSDSPAALADAVLPVEEIATRLPLLIGQAAANMDGSGNLDMGVEWMIRARSA